MKKNVNKNGWGRESDFDSFSYGRAYSCAPRCAGSDVHSFSFEKERTKKATRVSNSVLMGKLNCPLPKNFASKILPVENYILFWV